MDTGACFPICKKDMEKTILLPVAVLFLLGVLFFDKKADIKGLLLTKPVLSMLFVLTALAQKPLSASYFSAVMVALILCLIGDVCLIFQDSKKMFLAGLLPFLSGHAAYIAAFFFLTRIGTITWGALIIFSALGTIVYRWIRPNLGTMKIPVIVYILIITAMVTNAVSLFGNAALLSSGRYLVLIGALSFYLSDIFVARNQFVTHAYINRLCGLPLYYFGQFLLAISVAHVG
jgi:uncharacterized membrane protein YhhN